MNDVDAHSEDAENNPFIMEFVNLVDEVAGDGVLDFLDLQFRPFMKYWQHFIIYRHQPDIDDFSIRMFGSHLVDMIEKDCSGGLMSEIGLSTSFQALYDINIRVLSENLRIFTSGTLYWQNKEHKQWHSVKMPLRRNGLVNEVLACHIFL